MQQPDKQHYTLYYRLLEAGRYAPCQTTQCQLHSELVEGSGWARDPDKNLV